MSKVDRTPAEAIAFAEENGVDMVDLKLVDLPGAMRHVTVPAGRLTEELFAEGVAFDGSSIRGFHTDWSVLLLVPDPATAAVDPVPEIPTLSLVCDVVDPATGGRYPRDSRWVAQKAESYLEASGVADASRWGVAPEFFVFDAEPSDPGDGHGGERPGSPPVDTTTDIRSEATIKLAGFGAEVEWHRHGEIAAGHGQIAFESDSLTGAADAVMACRYLLEGTARDHGRAATFMPKPTAGEACAGMPTRVSLWAGGRNLFHGGGDGGMSETMAHYVGGLLAHAPALMAFCAPTTNSYRRLATGLGAPVDLGYSTASRTAAVRVPAAADGPSAGHVELRPPDPACNPYVAFSAILMAGVDGVLNGTDPGEPLDGDPTPRLPTSLGEALDALEADHDFLTRGDVFTEELIGTWLEYERTPELALHFDA